MGYTVWDRIKGRPAKPTRYITKSTAEKAAAKLNAADPNRYFVKPL